MNITLSVDEEIVKKVRKIAVDKNTSLNAMVRGYLESVSSGENFERQMRVQKLRHSFQKYSRPMEQWAREDLYDR